LMDKDYIDNVAIFPSAEVLAKCEPALYVGEEAIKARDEVWSRIQSA